VVHRAGDAGLGYEARSECLVTGADRGELLQGDSPIEVALAREVDDRGATPADHLE
jgi:hypothetical protein